MRKVLLVLGVVLTVLSSATIETCLILFMTDIAREKLRTGVMIGVAGVVVGAGLVWFGRSKNGPQGPGLPSKNGPQGPGLPSKNGL